MQQVLIISMWYISVTCGLFVFFKLLGFPPAAGKTIIFTHDLSFSSSSSSLASPPATSGEDYCFYS
jgi:hypothetical protein